MGRDTRFRYTDGTCKRLSPRPPVEPDGCRSRSLPSDLAARFGAAGLEEAHDGSLPACPEPPEVHTTELDWPDQARSDGWILSNGRWQHDDRAKIYDDGDWIYLGDGVWEDAVPGVPAGRHAP